LQLQSAAITIIRRLHSSMLVANFNDGWCSRQCCHVVAVAACCMVKVPVRLLLLLVIAVTIIIIVVAS